MVGSEILYHEVLGSTMDEAARLARGGCPEGTVVVADAQTGARGRFGRTWVSPAGQNLELSVVLRPPVDQLSYVNMAACLAVADAVKERAGLSPSIKWPNDVRVNGRKLSGILVESAVRSGEPGYAVVGIGLNVNLDPAASPEIASIATSLYRETGRQWDRTEVIKGLLERLDDLYEQIRRGRSLTPRWSALLETLGLDVTVRWGDRVVTGRAESVDDQGNLVLVRNDGSTFRVAAGEVTLQEQPEGGAGQTC